MTCMYLLDTNVISELTKPRPSPEIIGRISRNQRVSALPSIVWAEGLYGIKRMPESRRKERYLDFYLNAILGSFPFLPFDEHAASIFSDIKARLERLGRPAPLLDMQIAATAIANNAILVTRNVKDFEGICEVSSLMVENWWQPLHFR